MSPHQVYCFNCGSAQILSTVDESFILRCQTCQSVTIGMGNSWTNPAERTAVFLPLTPVICDDEMEFVCGDCEAIFSVELIMRSPHPSCERCAGLDKLTIQQPAQILSTSLLTHEELAFLAQSAT